MEPLPPERRNAPPEHDDLQPRKQGHRRSSSWGLGFLRSSVASKDGSLPVDSGSTAEGLELASKTKKKKKPKSSSKQKVKAPPPPPRSLDEKVLDILAKLESLPHFTDPAPELSATPIRKGARHVRSHSFDVSDAVLSPPPRQGGDDDDDDDDDDDGDELASAAMPDSIPPRARGLGASAGEALSGRIRSTTSDVAAYGGLDGICDALQADRESSGGSLGERATEEPSSGERLPQRRGHRRMRSVEVVAGFAEAGMLHASDVVGGLGGDLPPRSWSEVDSQLTSALLGMLGPEGASEVTVETPGVDTPSSSSQPAGLGSRWGRGDEQEEAAALAPAPAEGKLRDHARAAAWDRVSSSSSSRREEEEEEEGGAEMAAGTGLSAGAAAASSDAAAEAPGGDGPRSRHSQRGISAPVAVALAEAARSEFRQKSSVLSSALREVAGPGALQDAVRALEDKVIAGIAAMSRPYPPPAPAAPASAAPAPALVGPDPAAPVPGPGPGAASSSSWASSPATSKEEKVEEGAAEPQGGQESSGVALGLGQTLPSLPQHLARPPLPATRRERQRGAWGAGVATSSSSSSEEETAAALGSGPSARTHAEHESAAALAATAAAVASARLLRAPRALPLSVPGEEDEAPLPAAQQQQQQQQQGPQEEGTRAGAAAAAGAAPAAAGGLGSLGRMAAYLESVVVGRGSAAPFSAPPPPAALEDCPPSPYLATPGGTRVPLELAILKPREPVHTRPDHPKIVIPSESLRRASGGGRSPSPSLLPPHNGSLFRSSTYPSISPDPSGSAGDNKAKQPEQQEEGEQEGDELEEGEAAPAFRRNQLLHAVSEKEEAFSSYGSFRSKDAADKREEALGKRSPGRRGGKKPQGLLLARGGGSFCTWGLLGLAALLLALLIFGTTLLTVTHVRRERAAGFLGSPPGSIVGAPDGTGVGAGGAASIPVCEGPCCSSRAPRLPQGTPSRPSMWWSNSMTDEATVQLRALSSNLWLAADPDTASWRGIGAYAAELGAEQQLTVLRRSATQVHLRTREGYYLVAKRNGTIAADELNAEPSTVFTVVPVENSTQRVQLKTFDGRFVAVRSDGPLIHVFNDELAETFEVREVMLVPAFRGVNLGNWLLVEGWMAPSLFIRVPTFIDGLRFQLRSRTSGKWMGAREGGLAGLSCEAEEPGPWETFVLRSTREGDGRFEIRVNNLFFWTAPGGGGGASLRADRTWPGPEGFETFSIVSSPDERDVVMIQALDGHFLVASENGTVSAAAAPGSLNTGRGSPDWQGPAAFRVNQVSGVRGEWQLSRALGGGEDATAALEAHRAAFVAEADFEFLSEHNVNAVRIPVGHWIAQEDAPDYPFTSGGAAYLDRAFQWGEEYGVGVFVSMHGAPGSQNGFEHSGSRDGLAEWARNATRVEQMVNVTEWVARRYAASPAFAGVGLLNEPLAERVPLNVLKQYYRAAYDAVRKHSRCAAVSLQPRVGASLMELDDFMTEDAYTNVIVEAHMYNLVEDVFDDKDAAFNVEYVASNRTAHLARLQASGHAAMVGEWSLAMLEASNATDDDHAAFASAQLAAYSTARAGWFFWTYKIARYGFSDWSFREAMEKDWLKQKAGGGWI